MSHMKRDDGDRVTNADSLPHSCPIRIGRVQRGRGVSAGADKSVIVLRFAATAVRSIVPVEGSTMSWSLEAHLARFDTNERRLLLKSSAAYAGQFKERVFPGADRTAITGEEILRRTLIKIAEGSDEYIFRDGDILLFHCLCRGCRRTVLALYQDGADDGSAHEARIDAPFVLTEQAAVGFLQRHQSQDLFLAFVREKKLSGKLRAYATGFPEYAAERWDEAQIAKALRVTPATIATYRSRLRELIEQFELQRVRWHQG